MKSKLFIAISTLALFGCAPIVQCKEHKSSKKILNDSQAFDKRFRSASDYDDEMDEDHETT